MLHICCIRAGDAFSSAYVTNLKDMVARNLEAGFVARFVCFTDRPQDLDGSGIETEPLPANLPGWWSKLALFKRGLFPDGDRVLFFDLDTVITGAIDRLANWNGDRLAILRDFYRPFGLQSAVMAWRSGAHSHIWESYARTGCPTDDPRGDQRWIELSVVGTEVERLQDIFPKMFVSYKQTKGIPDQASVVVFHGHPRPHEVTDGWVPKVWKQGGLSHAELKAVCNTEISALLENVKSACKRDLPWLDERAEHDRHVAIIGGGPSVVDMLREIRWRKRQGQDVWVLNNAWRALDDVEIDAQVLLDARPETAKFIDHRIAECFVASQCAPEVFDQLRDQRVTLWHTNSPGMADLLKDEPHRPAYLIGGGTTVGMNAIAIAVALGYRQIHLYGFDSSYRDGAHHAYAQALNDADPRNDVVYGDKNYVCAPWMVGQAQEFIELAPGYEADGITITVHGSGLLVDIANDLRNSLTPAQVRAHEVLKRLPVRPNEPPGALGVEIGVFTGDMSRALLQAEPHLHLVMVDSWEANGAAYAKPAGDWHETLSEGAQELFFDKAKKRTAFAADRTTILRKRSLNALSDIRDRSCDFVFIDADHSYEGCKADIEGWARKVRPGGLLGGHDYQNPDFAGFGVTRAVDEFVVAHGLTLDRGENFCWFVQLKD